VEISYVLGIAAGVVHVIAYLDYNLDVIKGKRKPNGPTWAIWSSLALVSASSYFAITGDLAKSILSLTNVGLCIATFLIAFLLKRFGRPSKSDYIALLLGFSAVAIWYYFQSAIYANLIVQLAMIIGFIPTLQLVLREPRAERARPWLIWVFGYLLLTTTIILRWRGQWYDLVYPINCIIFHSAVVVFAAIGLKRLRQNSVVGGGKARRLNGVRVFNSF